MIVIFNFQFWFLIQKSEFKILILILNLQKNVTVLFRNTFVQFFYLVKYYSDVFIEKKIIEWLIWQKNQKFWSI